MDAEQGTEDSIEVSAGGVVVRARAGGGHEVALARQQDRNTGRVQTRLPKGHVDPGETLEAAAIREVLEEIGTTARIVAPLGDASYTYFEKARGEHVDKIVHYYLMAWIDGDGHPADGEMESVFWVELGAASQALDFDSERDAVRSALSLLNSENPPTL